MYNTLSEDSYIDANFCFNNVYIPHDNDSILRCKSNPRTILQDFFSTIMPNIIVGKTIYYSLLDYDIC